MFAGKVNENLRNNVDDFFVTLKYAEAMYSPTFVSSVQNLFPWRSRVKSDAIIKSMSPIALAQAAMRKDFSFMDSIFDTDGNPIFSDQDKSNFLQ